MAQTNYQIPSLETLDLEFEKEIYWNRFLERAGFIVGYGAYLICFVIVFGLKLEAVKYASLFLSGTFHPTFQSVDRKVLRDSGRISKFIFRK